MSAMLQSSSSSSPSGSSLGAADFLASAADADERARSRASDDSSPASGVAADLGAAAVEALAVDLEDGSAWEFAAREGTSS